MIGYNTRETFQDATYDVQTQSRQAPERTVETLVYRNGKIIATLRSPCPSDISADALRERTALQHEEVCGKVREGSYELIFLWISRGIIAFESQDYLHALESFESVLTIEETHAEANAYLDRIRSRIEEDPEARKRLLEAYEGQIESLERSGRGMEASRKRAVLERISQQTPRRERTLPGGGRKGPRGMRILSRGLLSRALPARQTVPSWLQTMGHQVAGVVGSGFPGTGLSALSARIRAALLLGRPRSVLSRHVLVSVSALLLLVLSGLIAADYQVRLDPAYHASLGKAYLKEHRFASARNLFYRVLQQDPSSEDALLGFWETFEQRGDYQRAAEMLEGLRKDEEVPARIDFYLAEAYRRASLCTEAIPFYQEALRKGSPEVPSKIGMGLCLLEEKGPSAALQLWEDLLSRGIRDYRIDYCLGAAYQRTGRLGRAAVHYADALQKHPESAPIYRALAYCLDGMHQEDKARRLRERAARLDDGDRNSTSCPAYLEMRGDAPGTSAATVAACFPFPVF